MVKSTIISLALMSMTAVPALSQNIPAAPIREVKTDLGLPMQPDEKIQWMLDDKLGMFIHWGIYAGMGKGLFDKVS